MLTKLDSYYDAGVPAENEGYTKDDIKNQNISDLSEKLNTYGKSKMAEELEIKLGDFMMPIRMAVTGSKVSPPLMGSIIALGTEKALERTDKAIAQFN